VRGSFQRILPAPVSEQGEGLGNFKELSDTAFYFVKICDKNSHYLMVNFFSSASCCCCCWSSAPLTVLLPEEDKAEVETRLRKIREWSSRGRGQEVKTEDEGAEEDLSVDSENEEKKMELSLQVKKKQRLRSPVWKYFKKCSEVNSIFIYTEGIICSMFTRSFFLLFGIHARAVLALVLWFRIQIHGFFSKNWSDLRLPKKKF
jgi:hypothetical protein